MNTEDANYIKARTMQLLERWQKEQDESARNEIIELNHKLIYFIANKFRNVSSSASTKISYDDLVSACHLGFLKAMNTYDMSNKATFVTYASSVMTHEVLMEIRCVKHSRNEVSLSTPVKANLDDNLELGDMIAGENNVDAFIEQDSLSTNFDLLIKFLPKCERDFIKCFCYYGASKDAVATEFNIDPSDVRLYLKNIAGCSKLRGRGVPRVSLFEQRDLLLHDEDFARLASNLDERNKAILQTAFAPQNTKLERDLYMQRLYLEDSITRFKLSKLTDMDFGIDHENGEILKMFRKSREGAESFIRNFPNGMKKIEKIAYLLSPVERRVLEKYVLKYSGQKIQLLPGEEHKKYGANAIRIGYDCMTQKFVELENVDNLDDIPANVMW